MGRWRVGSHYGIHVYEVASGEPGTENDDRPVATFHTVRDARAAVAAFNSREGAPRSDRARITVDREDLDATINLVERLREQWPRGWHRSPVVEREAFDRLRRLTDTTPEGDAADG